MSARSVEAMRLGVVACDDVEAFTVGRGGEVEVVDSDLDRTVDEGGALRAFLGDYGTGKTHMLEILRERALERGFLVANVVLDPNETAPSHPKRVYRALVRNLEYPDRRTQIRVGLEPLLGRGLERDAVLERFRVERGGGPLREEVDEGAHLYLTPALRYLKQLDELEGAAGESAGVERARALLLDWLEGAPTVSNVDIDRRMRRVAGGRGKIYSLMDYRPWARIYGYILSGLGVLARECGYAGLVVAVDEAEFYSLLSSENRDFARILFKALSFAAVGEVGGRLPFDRSELDLGGYGVQQDLPPRYGDRSNVYAAFAMTPHNEGLEALSEAVPEQFVTQLSRLDDDDYARLVGLVVDRYRAALGSEDGLYDKLKRPLTELVSGFIGSGHIENPRQAMKFLVEFLDLCRHRRADIKRVIADLRDIYGGGGGLI